MLPTFPFEYDEFDMPMNVRALPGDRLIEITDHYQREIALKEQILAGDYRYYVQSLPGTEAMQWEALAHLLPIIARHYPEQFNLTTDGDRWRWTNRLLKSEITFTLHDTGSLPAAPHEAQVPNIPTTRPLDWLGHQVQEDLILMDGALSGTPLVAGHLCFGSSWALDDKLGKSFLAVHQEVPLFADRIGRPADLAMQRLKAGRPIGRVNWSIFTTDRLNCAPCTFHEWLHTRRGITMHNAGERLFLRIERQTLSRLPQTNGILFTIHTSNTPISEIAADPHRLRRFTSVVKGIPRTMREYKGMAAYADALIDYLEARCRAAAGHPPTTAGKDTLTTGGAERERIPVEPPSPVWILPAVDAPGSEWQPWPLEPMHMLEGDPHARVRWLRRNGPNEPYYRAGLLAMEPSSVRVLLTANETCHILSGRATIRTDTGAALVLGPGDMASFPINTIAVWTIHEPLIRFFVSTK